MHLRDAAIVTADEADQDLRVDPPGIFVDMAHDAEIVGDDVARRGNLQIALMHVGMEESVAQRVAQEELQYAFGERGAVVPGRPDRQHLAQRDPLRPAERHHPPRGQFPVGHGHLEPGIAPGVVGEFRGSRAFKPQIQLAHHHALEMADDVRGPEAARRGRQNLDQSRGEMKGVDVTPEGTFDPGAENLDRDVVAAIDRPCAMNLRDRGCGHRIAELGEQLRLRASQFRLDGRDRHVGRKRRQLVLKHP